jgi:hypothetical protein
MKSSQNFRPAAIVAFLLLGVPAILAAQYSPKMMQEGSVLHLYFFAPHGDADPAAAHHFLKNEYFPALHNHLSEGRVVQLWGERGEHTRRDVLMYVADAPEDRALDELTENMAGPELEGAYHRLIDGVDESLSGTYRVLETGKPLRRDWLNVGSIFGVHRIQLKPEVDTGEFEHFIHNMWAPAQSDALPNSKFIFLKSVGDEAPSYAYLWIMDSEETRDFYFPRSGEPSSHYTEFERGWSYINDDEHLGKYLAEDSEDVFTDYVVVQ